MSTAKEWFPHEMVPWSRGRDYAADEVWDPGDHEALRRSAAQRAVPQHPHRGQPPALLPPDQRQVRQRRRLGRMEPPLDGRRGPARDRDPRLPRGARARSTSARSSARACVRSRWARCPTPTPSPTASSTSRCRSSPPASRTATPGKLLNDPQGAAIMSRVAADENLHHLFYRDLVSAALEIDPSGMVAAIDRQVRSFEMPGAGIADFKTHARVDRRRRRVRLRRRTTTRSSCRSCSSTGASSSCRT